MTQEVLKMALEALETNELDIVDDGSGNMVFRTEQAITAIKEALAQPTTGDYALGYAEGFNDACKKPARPPVAKPHEQEPDDFTVWRSRALQAEAVIDKFMAQPQQEPVAWVVYSSAENDIVWADKGKRLKQNTPLYTSPPAQRPWVGLSDEEALECWPGLAMYADCAKFWENIESKLKEKNEATQN